MAIFSNQATLSYSGGTVNSNVTTGEIIEVLSANKTAVVDEYSVGSDVTYVVNIINSGAIPFTGIRVSDDLGEYTFGAESRIPLDYIEDSVKLFVNGVLQPAPTVTAGPPLTFSGITVPSDGNITLIYAARANEFADPTSTGTIENTATINGGGITEITASETIFAEAEPQLNITKSLSPATITENGQLTYTFVIQNTGNSPAEATDNVVITDRFDPALSNITVTYNGASWTEPANYTYDETTGLFTTTAGSITIPAATYTQDPVTGNWLVDPSVATITVTGTV